MTIGEHYAVQKQPSCRLSFHNIGLNMAVIHFIGKSEQVAYTITKFQINIAESLLNLQMHDEVLNL